MTGIIKSPQIGTVIIEDDVEIGANTTVDRATMTNGATVIKRGTKIDNLVQIAHNVVIGEDCRLAAQVGIAGSAVLKDRVTVAGQAGVVGHLTIGGRYCYIRKVGRHQKYTGWKFCLWIPGTTSCTRNASPRRLA